MKEARKIARTLPSEKRAAVEAMCVEIEALMKELAELQARGEVRDKGRRGQRRGEEEEEEEEGVRILFRGGPWNISPDISPHKI